MPVTVNGRARPENAVQGPSGLGSCICGSTRRTNTVGRHTCLHCLAPKRFHGEGFMASPLGAGREASPIAETALTPSHRNKAEAVVRPS